MPDTVPQQLVVFSLGSEEYALPSGDVHEIIRYTERSEGGKIVIVESGSITAGVMVDDVEEVLTIDDEQLDGVPASGSEAIDGIAKIDDRLIVLLDLEGLFGGIDLAAAA